MAIKTAKLCMHVCALDLNACSLLKYSAIRDHNRTQDDRLRAALTIGLGGAEAPGPEQGGGP